MKLADWIKKKNTTVAAVAKQLGVNAWTIHRYANEDRLPEPAPLLKLYKLTGGAVEPNDWYDLKSAKSLKLAAPKKTKAKAKAKPKAKRKPAKATKKKATKRAKPVAKKKSAPKKRAKAKVVKVRKDVAKKLAAVGASDVIGDVASNEAAA
jgi:hypothetical protein